RSKDGTGYDGQRNQPHRHCAAHSLLLVRRGIFHGPGNMLSHDAVGGGRVAWIVVIKTPIGRDYASKFLLVVGRYHAARPEGVPGVAHHRDLRLMPWRERVAEDAAEVHDVLEVREDGHCARRRCLVQEGYEIDLR